jgi:hypothetical protein
MGCAYHITDSFSYFSFLLPFVLELTFSNLLLSSPPKTQLDMLKFLQEVGERGERRMMEGG